jgi:hypothetical protein
VYAVVVARAEVNRGKAAVLKLRCQRGVATHQRGSAVEMPFGLKNLVFGNGAKLADGAVHRTDPRAV